MECAMHVLNCEDLQVQYQLSFIPHANDEGTPFHFFSPENPDILRFEENYMSVLAERERLTNSADEIDYMIAAASGLIAGLIDAFWVGEISLESANKWGTTQINQFVIHIAKKQGYTGDDLKGAVRKLESDFPLAADKVYAKFGGGLQHHLRDFSHHPTLVGLCFSLLTQFTGNVYGTDVAGFFQVVPLDSAGMELIGKSNYEKIVLGVVQWFFHMVSDMAGSSSSIALGRAGTGLPGPLGSLLKEISALPLFQNLNEKGYKKFSVWVSKLFNGTLLAKRDENGTITQKMPFDLRTEIGVIHKIRIQSVPVLINECTVRAFYFIRRFVMECKKMQVNNISEISRISWRKILPFNNRTIVRMCLISSGTMELIDLFDATIRSAACSFGNPALFTEKFVIRINFVGLGHFFLAGTSDILMEINKGRTELAATHAEVAQTAVQLGRTVGKIQQQQLKTEDMLNTLCNIPINHRNRF